jgi:hercynylcysteine S-oxide lyase
VCLLPFASSTWYSVLISVGSYGTTPLPVLAAVSKMNMEIEANPDKFHRITYMPRLVEVRRKLAQLIGANTDECVMVQNATMHQETKQGMR